MVWRADGSISEHQDRETNKVQPHQGCRQLFEPRFPYYHCDLSVSAHTLIRMPATRRRTLRIGASRAG